MLGAGVRRLTLIDNLSSKHGSPSVLEHIPQPKSRAAMDVSIFKATFAKIPGFARTSVPCFELGVSDSLPSRLR